MKLRGGLAGGALAGMLLASSCAVAEGSGTAGDSVGDAAPPLVTATTATTVVPTTTSTPTPTPTPTTAAPPAPEFPRFRPDEYGSLVDSLVLPDTSMLWPPGITGDPAADERIRWLAEQRGYRLRPVTQTTLVAESGVLVHPGMTVDLRALLDEARFWGLTLEVASGYRSVDRQGEIFRRELLEQAIADLGRELTLAEIASGAGDAQLLAVLRWHSVPGYSRHHSGFTVDFDAGGTVAQFEGSPAEEWLRADDFANAKRYGFVPSYPRGSPPQGPEPEPWEFVYVGSGTIRCAALHVPMQDPDAVRSCPLVS